MEVIADSKIIVSEIYYNPNGPDEAREFIEIKNVGDLAEDISGWQFTNGVNYTFPNQTFLGPGEFYVIVANAQFFATQYPQVAIGGQYIDDDGAGAGRAGLSNRGERITLKDGPITKTIPKNVTKKRIFTVNEIFSLSTIIENRRTYIGYRQKIRIVKLTSINITEVNNPSVNNIEPADIDKKYLRFFLKISNRFF